MDNLMNRIIELTGVTADEFTELQEREGYNYARLFTGNNDEAVQLLTESAMYWAWYRNQWDLIDEAFARAYLIADTNDTDVKESLRLMWMEEHRAECIKGHPGQIVMHSIYTRLASERLAYERQVDALLQETIYQPFLKS